VKKAACALPVLTLALLILHTAALGRGPGDHITGKVSARSSSPARSVWVMVYDGPTLKGRSLTGDDGRYYIAGLDDKTYTIVVRKQASGSNLVSQSVVLPQNRVHDITLP
jgi:Carboxypeptidase regulatory-like domain